VSVDRLIALLLVIVSGAYFVRLAPIAIRSWRVYSGTGHRHQQDASGRTPPMPADVADRIALLGEAGYHRLGETSLELPVGTRYAWIVAADDAESYAILVGGVAARPSLTGIYSAWSDGTWLGTQHPFGAQIDRAGLQMRIVPSTLAEAARVHRESLDRLRVVHGAPRPVRVMADMLALDLDYRTRFGGMRLRPMTLRIVLPAVVVGCTLVLSLALLLLVR
jgi:hypothetical protein